MRINWAWFCTQIIDELLVMPASDRSITLPLGELLRRTKAVGMEPKGFRNRVFWANALRGRGAWKAAHRAGLSVSLIHNEPGGEVQAVTFRLDEQQSRG